MHELDTLYLGRDHLLWLKSHGKIDRWKERFINILCVEFPTGEYENWDRCRPLFPHVKSAMSQRPASPQGQQQWATLLYRGAWYAWQSGKIADIGEMASKSREQRRILLGDEHEEVIDSTSMLATAYWLYGRWEEAKQLFVQVMETRKTKLGEDHPDTLMSMANLAFTWKSSGHDAQAIDLLRNCLDQQRRKLGLDHPYTLSTSRTLLVWETDNLEITS